MAAGAPPEIFNEEIRQARSRYTAYGRLTLPWLKWGPERTAEEAWRDLQERRKDPAHMAWVAQAQKEIDDKAEKTKAAVQAELEARKAIADYKHEEKMREQQARARRMKNRAKRHGRLSWAR